MSLLRPSLRPPTAIALNRVHRINFRHPAYPESEQPLLRLTSVDGASQDGVDYYTALVACGIITGNTWPDGWLAVKNGVDTFLAVDRPEDGILRGKEYFYFVGQHEPNYKYPVVPSFDHWRFPHNRLPVLWDKVIIPAIPEVSVLKKKAAALARDNTCRISGYGNASEVAHFVPLSDGYWFNSNDMERYCGEDLDRQPIDDQRNLVVLRRDLHYLFNQRRFTLVPKYAAGHQEPQLAIHILLPQQSTELIDLYHNRVPQALAGISIEMIFSRFAWSIFADEHIFFLNGMNEYAVQLFNVETGQSEVSKLYAPQIRARSKLFDSYPRSRSVSSRERTCDQATEYDMSPNGSTVSYGLSSDLDHDSFIGPDEETRGRRRNRSRDRRNVDSPPDLADPCSSAGSDNTSRHPSDPVDEIELPSQDINAVHPKQRAASVLGAEGVSDERPQKRINLGRETNDYS